MLSSFESVLSARLTSGRRQEHEREAARAWDDNAIDVPGKVTKISLTTLSRYDMVKSRVW